MSTFSQVLSSQQQGRRQLWLVHGNEQALVHDAFELAKEHVFSLSGHVSATTFFGKQATAAEISYKLAETSIDSRSLVILLDGDEFMEWDRLAPVLRSLPRTHFFISVCNEELPRDSSLLPIFKSSAKARNVLCRPFSEDEALAWISTKLTIEDGASRFLIEHAKGDYEWLLNELKKLSLIRVERISLELVERLCYSYGIPNLEDSVLNYRKRDAILSIQNSISNGSVVNKILAKVRKAALVNESTRVIGFFSVPRINDRTKLKANEIIESRPLSRLYDRTNVQMCLQACLVNYDKLHRGEKRYWLSLVSRW